MAVAFVALVAGICAAYTHAGCFHPPPPVTRPVPSTPRAEYCDVVNSVSPWFSLTAIPVLVTAGLAFLMRHRPRVVAAIALVVSVLLITNAGVANSLTYNVPLR
jgi:hypothetical protein